MLQGLTIDTVTGVNEMLEQAARVVVQAASIPEASGRLAVNLLGGVTDYEAPGAIFGTSLVDFRPQGTERAWSDKVYKKPIELLDRTKHSLPNGYSIAFEYKNGVGIMRVATPRALPTVSLDPIDSLTGWTAAGSAGSLVLDQLVRYKSPASFRFTLTGASSGTLTKAITSVDLTDYLSVGIVLVAIRTPSATNLTSIEVRIGSSASDYYSVTATEGLLGAWTADDWLVVPFDLSTATTTGSPVITAVDYARISIVHAATLTNFRVGSLSVSLPVPHELIFETAAIFQDEQGAMAQTISSDNDVVILSDPALNLYEHEAALTIARAQGGNRANNLIERYENRLYGPDKTGKTTGMYANFRATNPSSRVKEVDTYYNLRPFRSRGINRGRI